MMLGLSINLRAVAFSLSAMFVLAMKVHAGEA